jgi:hypothetical protein
MKMRKNFAPTRRSEPERPRRNNEALKISKIR